MNLTGRFPNHFGISVIATRGTADVSPASLSPHARTGVLSLLSRAVGDPMVTQQLRAVLAMSPQDHGQVFRLDNREVIRQVVDLVIRGEVILAFTSATASAPKRWNAFKHGDKLPDPVKFDQKRRKWIAVWDTTTTPQPGELGSAPSELEPNATGTKLTPKSQGPQVATELLTTLEEIENEVKEAEKEQQDTAKVQKDEEKELAQAKKERDAAQKKLDAAKTEEEKKNAQIDLENAEEKIKMHQMNIEAHKKHIEKQKQKVNELRAKTKRGIENVRLHEQTHFDITAKAAEHANELLKREPDPTKRQTIIDAATAVTEATDEAMDKLLNPINFGAIEDDQKLTDWISESGSPNYRSTIKDKFKAKGL